MNPRLHSLELLVEALARVRRRRGLGKLRLIGGGPLSERPHRQVESLGEADNVVFAGAILHAGLKDYLALADIAVRPGANACCCPVKIIECMACGKAIAAPRQENIAELLEDGSEALLFQPGDVESLAGALEQVVTDPGLRRRLGADARAAVRRRGLHGPALPGGSLTPLSICKREPRRRLQIRSRSSEGIAAGAPWSGSGTQGRAMRAGSR